MDDKGIPAFLNTITIFLLDDLFTLALVLFDLITTPLRAVFVLFLPE